MGIIADQLRDEISKLRRLEEKQLERIDSLLKRTTAYREKMDHEIAEIEETA